MDTKVRRRFRFSTQAWDRMRCSFCEGGLEETADGAFCDNCSTNYQIGPSGALDLRLARPRRVTCAFEVGRALDTATIDFGPLQETADQSLLHALEGVPWHFSRELLSFLPRAANPDAIALDLGCGAGMHRGVCEKLGYDWVGLDYTDAQAPILGDAHALPFASESFDFILSMAVLEHLQYPPVAMNEAWRVLKPGGSFVGTVAFLEPFHGNSYYHHTHLGTLNSLRTAGFEVTHVAPSMTWTVLKAQADMALFPKMPGWMMTALITPLHLAHRLWWAIGRLLGKTSDSTSIACRTTGMFAFVARKPALST
jgi:SAM-dependent methyltransferase